MGNGGHGEGQVCARLAAKCEIPQEGTRRRDQVLRRGGMLAPHRRHERLADQLWRPGRDVGAQGSEHGDRPTRVLRAEGRFLA